MRLAYPPHLQPLLCSLHSTHVGLLSLLQIGLFSLLQMDQVLSALIPFPLFDALFPSSERTADFYPLGFAKNVSWPLSYCAILPALISILSLYHGIHHSLHLTAPFLASSLFSMNSLKASGLFTTALLMLSSEWPLINIYWRMKECWTLNFPFAPCSFFFQAPGPAAVLFLPL